MDRYGRDKGLDRRNQERLVKFLLTKKILQDRNKRGESDLKDAAMRVTLFYRGEGMIYVHRILMPEQIMNEFPWCYDR